MNNPQQQKNEPTKNITASKTRLLAFSRFLVVQENAFASDFEAEFFGSRFPQDGVTSFAIVANDQDWALQFGRGNLQRIHEAGKDLIRRKRPIYL